MEITQDMIIECRETCFALRNVRVNTLKTLIDNNNEGELPEFH